MQNEEKFEDRVQWEEVGTEEKEHTSLHTKIAIGEIKKSKLIS